MDRILSDRGIDPKQLKWQDLALCRGADFTLFFEAYERSESTAMQVDAMCLACPVTKQCKESGKNGGESGVWGGYYLTVGKEDIYKNSHKTPEVKARLEEKTQ